ncbi:MAG: ectoine hydroxylase-related dioxygenase (phytanoyl-CoA dioxygenase family) [Limisphaerales bacterium]|jgi:ectoine hydroxylase-related dioxygenase (phytanoyl-CoA dioxygenase family)
MSLDALVKDEGKAPLLCLPHQCEFLSDQWLHRAREFLERAVAKPTRQLPAFSLTERFVDAPPHLGCKDNLAQWSVKFDGKTLLVDRLPLAHPDVHVEGAYQAGLFMAQVVGAQVRGAMAEAFAEMKHLFGADVLHSTGRFNDPLVAEVVAQLHDHMARMTVENPDLYHRAAALGVDKHIRDVEAQGYTVIENAISPEFADKVRQATQRAVMSHDGVQLQWMLYHGLEFERLVQNAPLMTLMDASLGRGAGIASISAIVKGPGLGTIPLHNDYSMVPEPYPEFAMTGVGVWALEDWTVASGPTWIVPGSHLERRAPRKGEGLDRGIAIEMPKGSVVYFTHGVWHWQGDRTEPGERVTIHSHFNRGILRGLEPKRVDVQMMHRNAPRLGEMLGEDDWFDKLDAHGRDYLRAGHMSRLQAFNDQRKQALLATCNDGSQN